MLFQTPTKRLFRAIRRNQLKEVVACLQDLPPDTERKGVNALSYAARLGHTAIVEFLLNSGANPYWADGHGQTVFHHACQHLQFATVELLALASPSVIDQRDDAGLTALNYANWEGQQAMANTLADFGANPAWPIHHLAQQSWLEVEGMGQDIQWLHCELYNPTYQSRNITVLSGTVFHSGQCQDMIVLEEEIRYLPWQERLSITLEVACLQAEQAIPNKGNHFYHLGYADFPVRYLVDHLHDKGWGAVQAGIWAYKDQYSSDEIRNLLRTSQDGSRVIDTWEIEQAAEVLDRMEVLHNLL